jgi:hypothetical protein
MDFGDALVLALLAVADIALLVNLRRSRGRRIREQRMMRSLQVAIDREAGAQAFPQAQRTLRRAS